MSERKRASGGSIMAAVASWLVYGLALLFLQPLMGSDVVDFAILPVVVTAFLLGLWAGLGAGLTVLPFTLVVLLLSGEEAWRTMTEAERLLDSIPLVVVGVGVGLLHGKILQASEELRKRSRAEEALQKSEAALQLQFQRMPIGCIVWSPEGRVQSWNPAATKIFGYSAEEALGRHPNELLVPEGAQREVNRTWQRLLEGEAIASSVNENVSKDGRRIVCDWTSTPLMEKGAVVGVLSMVQDITEHVRSEAQLKESEARMRQMQKMEAIGQLAGGIAHDFNNILMVILGFSDVLISKLGPGDQLQEHVRTIKTAALRARDLTQQLLAFSRKQMLQPRVVALNELVGESEKMLRRLLREDIELVLDLGPQTGQVKVDPGQINQILMNLAANASDAMPQGGKLLIETSNVKFNSETTKRHPELLQGRYVMMAVSDTGVGMDEETKSHIFEPFFTTKGLGKGTGLGLATIYGIVKQSGGYIYVYSELGKGTTFKLFFPRVDISTTTDEVSDTEDQQPLHGAETVLLVEDEDEVRAFVRLVLQEHGYTVVEAKNGLEALARCRQLDNAVDAMVTDVVMPQMGGREAVREIKQLCPDIAVLFLTGYTEDFVSLNEMLDGGVTILQKPLRGEELLRKLRAGLDRRAAAKA